jgi:histidinol phosphatase-like PHP family hydrolase
LHSLIYSDGLNTIDELAVYGHQFELQKIVITDHSQAALDRNNIGKKTARSIAGRWKNIHNDLDVSFGVEGDVLNDQGDICDTIEGMPGEFMVLSCHPKVYAGSHRAEGFVKAIERHYERINIIGHVMLGLKEEEALKVINTANHYEVPLEINAKYFLSSPEKWKVVLDNAAQLYVNSDAHTLYELKERRKDARAKIVEMGYRIE